LKVSSLSSSEITIEQLRAENLELKKWLESTRKELSETQRKHENKVTDLEEKLHDKSRALMSAELQGAEKATL